MVSRLDTVDSGEIFRRGLHEVVNECLIENARLNDDIAAAYHFD